MACQQLGFEWGNFSFISWARNDTLNMLYHRPECTGEETHLMDCPRAHTIEIGTNICGEYFKSICLKKLKIGTDDNTTSILFLFSSFLYLFSLLLLRSSPLMFDVYKKDDEIEAVNVLEF